MITAIDVTYSTETIQLPDPIFIKVWEEPSFKDATLKANSIALNLEFGVVVLLVDKYEDISSSPSTTYIYRDRDGNELDKLQAELSEYEVFVERVVTHSEEWTKGLGIEDNYRLILHYCPDKDIRGDVENYYTKMWRGGV